MKRLFANILAVAVLLSAMVPGGCSEDEDLIGTQRERIESYLESNLGLVTEEEADQSLTGELLPYYTVCGETYRYIANVYRTDRPSQVIDMGDVVMFHYESYTFETAPATIPFATNIRESGAVLAGEYGLDTTYWDFSPRVVRLGGDPILKGLESSLPQCAAGDTVYVFMPSTAAYDDKSMGVVAANTAVMMLVIIDSVEK